MATTEQTNKFIFAVQQAAEEIGLNPEDKAGLLLGCAHRAMEEAHGPLAAAHQCYVLALMLAKRAGIDKEPLPSSAKH